MPECTATARCIHCRKPIVRERVGWRSDEHDLTTDRVLCTESPEQDAWNKKHVPDQECPCGFRTGDLP